MTEYRVTFEQNCTIVVRHVLAKDEQEAIEKAGGLICTEAAKTSFDVWPGYGEAEEE